MRDENARLRARVLTAEAQVTENATMADAFEERAMVAEVERDQSIAEGVRASKRLADLERRLTLHVGALLRAERAAESAIYMKRKSEEAMIAANERAERAERAERRRDELTRHWLTETVLARRTVHLLKCWPRFFEAVLSGSKRHEVRLSSDRVFEVGDVLDLREFDPEREAFTGRAVLVPVLFVTTAVGRLNIPGDLDERSLNLEGRLAIMSIGTPVRSVVGLPGSERLSPSEVPDAE